jgi:hypothetical protein
LNVLSLGVEPSAVACGQKLAINHQFPCYRLTASFGLGVQQDHGVFNRRYAVADFDPAPQLDAFWADALEPFRAVPRGDFGYRLVLRVVEDTAAVASPSY